MDSLPHTSVLGRRRCAEADLFWGLAVCELPIPQKCRLRELLTPEITDITLRGGLVIQTTVFTKEGPKGGPNFGGGTCVGTEGQGSAVEHNLCHSNTGNFCQAMLCSATEKVVKKWRKRKLLEV